MHRYRASAIIILGILAGTLFWGAFWTSEPVYAGRRASAWIRDLQGRSQAERERAESALRAMGTNVLPVIRRQLYVQDSTLKLTLVHLIWRQDRVRFRLMLARSWRARAAMACGVLGAEAQPLIPDLLESAKGDFVSFELAVGAMTQIGEVGIPQFVGALTNANPRVRQAGARVLGALGPKGKAGLGVLVKSLRDPDAQVRVNASAALGAIGVGSPEVVDGLANALGDANSEVRDNALDALGQLGLPARAAIPAVVQLLSDPDELVRSDATNVLETLPVHERVRRTNEVR